MDYMDEDTTMAKIDDDMMAEILIRLSDSRETGRCKAVCRRWSTIVSATGFVRLFTDRRNQLNDDEFFVEPVALLFEKPYSVFSDSMEEIDCKYHLISTCYYLNFSLPDDTVIRASYDDLLLLSSPGYDLTGILSLRIYNPLFKDDCIYIPEPPIGIVSYLKCALMYRSEASYLVTLFSFAPYSRYGPMMVLSFSSETGQWCKATVPEPPHVCMGYPFLQSAWAWSFNELVACADGFVYWFEGRFPHWESVVSFDMYATPSSEGHRAYGIIPLPDEAGKKPFIYFVRLGAYRGRLRAICVMDYMRLKLWELTRTGDSCRWSLVHYVNLENRFCCWTVQPLALHPANCNVVYLQIHGRDILQFNMSTRTGKYVGTLPFSLSSHQFAAYPLCSAWPTSIKCTLRSS